MSFSTLSAAPASRRSSGLMLPRPFMRSEIAPFLPSAATRTASSGRFVGSGVDLREDILFEGLETHLMFL